MNYVKEVVKDKERLRDVDSGSVCGLMVEVAFYEVLNAGKEDEGGAFVGRVHE